MEQEAAYTYRKCPSKYYIAESCRNKTVGLKLCSGYLRDVSCSEPGSGEGRVWNLSIQQKRCHANYLLFESKHLTKVLTFFQAAWFSLSCLG